MIAYLVLTAFAVGVLAGGPWLDGWLRAPGAYVVAIALLVPGGALFAVAGAYRLVTEVWLRRAGHVVA